MSLAPEQDRKAAQAELVGKLENGRLAIAFVNQCPHELANEFTTHQDSREG
jgi:hypothetical protein